MNAIIDSDGHLRTISELNEIVRRGDFAEQVMADENRHVRRIVRIAELVSARVPIVRLVLVAGPSSAGKTTTAIRLCRRLNENGREAIRLSTDDYFVNGNLNPVDEHGQADWETVEAVDRRRLVSDLTALLAGESVRLRRFDFERHAGYDDAEPSQLPSGGLVVLEGIHALNPLLTEGVAEALKFRVYLNVLTFPRPGDTEVFFAEDCRLIRRIVRDSANRGMSAAATLARWPSVEAGERKWIDPFRRLADAVFNSALDYELAVLRPFALDLLRGVAADDPSYAEASRLSRVLSSVSEASPLGVPGNSILREAIGDSELDY